jgi:hypothetical protein
VGSISAPIRSDWAESQGQIRMISNSILPYQTVIKFWLWVKLISCARTLAIMEICTKFFKLKKSANHFWKICTKFQS